MALMMLIERDRCGSIAAGQGIEIEDHKPLHI